MISLGAIIAAFRDCISSTGAWPLLLALPICWYILKVVKINKELISIYVLNGHYLWYALWIFLLCYTIPLFGIALEWLVREYFNLGHTIRNYFSPWILLDSLSTCVLLMLIMFGMAIGQLYIRWRAELRCEHKAAWLLKTRLIQFKDQIQADLLLAHIDDLISACESESAMAISKLQSLSKELRKRLYEQTGETADSNIIIAPINKTEVAISSRRYRWIRILILELFLAVISVTSLFPSPDQPDFSVDSFIAFIGMYIVFNVLIYGNIILTKRYIKNGELVGYLVRGALFILSMTLIITIVEILTYSHSAMATGLPIGYSILSTIASFSCVFLVLGGISSFLALQQWILQRRRIIKLDAETKQVELSLLQSQINPHFLFNVLNNIGMLVYESGKEASEMLAKLRSLLKYQLLDMDRSSTTVGEEISFINNYLSLEKSRKDPFEYNIDIIGNIENVEIPTLILIPFIENASKHSTVVNGKREINIIFEVSDNKFVFTCENTFDVHKKRIVNGKAGGLGLSNTRRRLDLIYESDFTWQHREENQIYIIEIRIPLK